MTILPERVIVGNGAIIFCIVGKLADGLIRLLKMISGNLVFGFSRQGIVVFFICLIPRLKKGKGNLEKKLPFLFTGSEVSVRRKPGIIHVKNKSYN